MATKQLRIEDTAGVNNYFTVWRSSDNLIFDFNDNTFKAIGSATTPYLAATENTNTGGTGRSHYTASLNLALLGSVDAFVQAYRRSGGTPAPLTDATIEDPFPIEVRAGSEGGAIGGRINAVYKRGLNEFEALFTLTLNGAPISLSGATGTLTVRDALGNDVFAALTGSLIEHDTDAGFYRMKWTQSAPGFTGDRAYDLRAVITLGSVTITIDDVFNMLE